MTTEPGIHRARRLDSIRRLFFNLAARGIVPARLFERRLPPAQERRAASAPVTIEIVSHCWQYAHFLVYQLSSLVRYPPTGPSVRMTVYYSPEDHRTASLLSYFSGIDVPGVEWNWRPLPRQQLFRRAIGRNDAALATTADWVWFTDCDLMFREGCLDTLAMQLEGRRDALVYPREERRTALLEEDHPLLRAGELEPQVLDIEAAEFTTDYPTRATGPLQIAHGDVCRACGYCDSIACYQTPAEQWCKAREDRVFRWLLRTPGIALDIPGVYRIRHVFKGRYVDAGSHSARLRSMVRKLQSHRRERWTR